MVSVLINKSSKQDNKDNRFHHFKPYLKPPLEQPAQNKVGVVPHGKLIAQGDELNFGHLAHSRFCRHMPQFQQTLKHLKP